MKNTNEPFSENRGNRKTSEDQIRGNRNGQLEPKPEKDFRNKEESAFMKTVKKLGFSVWMIVMIIGAGLAFIVAIFLI